MVGLRGDTKMDCGSKEFIRGVISAMNSSSSMAGHLQTVWIPYRPRQQGISQPGSLILQRRRRGVGCVATVAVAISPSKKSGHLEVY